MPKVCHAHCPDEGGGFLAVLAAVVLAAVVWIVASVVDAIVVTAAVALGSSVVGLGAYLVRPAPGRRRGARAGLG